MTQARVLSALGGVRDSTKKELEARCSATQTTQPRPAVGTRAAEISAGALTHGVEEVIGVPKPAVVEELDPLEFIDEVDLLAALAKTDCAALCAATKWSDKKQALVLIDAAIGSTPKLKADTHLQDLLRTLKPLINHTHQAVSSAAIKIIGRIAQGLRGQFGLCCHELQQFRLIVGRLKDKKLVPIVGETLHLMVRAGALSLGRVEGELPALVDQKKQPVMHARVAVLEWLSRCVNDEVAKGGASLPTQLKISLLALAKAGLDGTESATRGAGETLLCAVCVAADKDVQSKEHRAMLRALEEFEASHKRAAQRALQVLRCAPTSLQNVASKHSQATTPSKLEPLRSSVMSTRGCTAELPSTDIPKEKDCVCTGENQKVTVSASECANVVLSLLSEGTNNNSWKPMIQAKLDSPKWQDKNEAFAAIMTRCRASSAAIASSSSEPLVMLAETRTKAWKESNVSSMKCAFEMICACAEACSANELFHRGAAASVVPVAIGKLADRKLKESAAALLNALMEAVGISFLISNVKVSLPGLKAIAATTAALEWVVTSITEFGAAVFPLKTTCSLAHQMLSHRESKVRGAALEVLSELYRRIGPRIRPVAVPGSLVPAHKKDVEEALAKAGFGPEQSVNIQQPSRVSKIVDGGSSARDVLERSDISALLDVVKLISKMNCSGAKDAWKHRKSALDDILAAVTNSGDYLKANKHIFDILRHMKGRIQDTQMNIKPVAIKAIVSVLRALDSSAGPKALRVVSVELVAAIHDNKKPVREKVSEAMDMAMTLSNGSVVLGCFDVLLPVVCSALSKPVGRPELLAWIAQHAKNTRSSKMVDAQHLLSPILLCLSDKSKESRDAAFTCLRAVICAKLVRKTDMNRAAQDLPPSIKRAIQPFIDDALGTLTSESHTSASTTVVLASSLNPSPEAAPSIYSTGTGATSAAGEDSNSVPTTSQMIGDWAFHPCGLRITTNKAKRDSEPKCGSSWPLPPEDPKTHEAELLERQWAEYLTVAAARSFFPKVVGKMECSVHGLKVLEDALAGDGNIVTEHLDFVFKWLSIRLCERESASALQRLLEFTENLLNHIVTNSRPLSELEAMTLVPYILDRSGQSKPRFRTSFRKILVLVSQCWAPHKYAAYLLTCCSGTKKDACKVICLEELSRLLVDADSMIPIDGIRKMKSGGTESASVLRDVAAFVESKDNGVREAALHVLVAAYRILNYDEGGLFRLLGNGDMEPSPKALVLITERMKSIVKDRQENAVSSHWTECAGRAPSCDSCMAAVPNQTSSSERKTPTAPVTTFTGSSQLFAVNCKENMETLFRYQEPPPTPALKESPLPSKSSRKKKSRRQRKSGFGVPLGGVLPSFMEIRHALVELLALPNESAEHRDAYCRGRDVIKQVYSMASSMPKMCLPNDEAGSACANIDDIFAGNDDEIMGLVIRCMSKAFVCGPEAKSYIDDSLLALSLAAMSSLIRASGCAARCSAATIEHVLGETCHRMLEGNANGTRPTLSNTMLQALNRVSVEVASYGQRTASVVALLHLLAGRRDPNSGNDGHHAGNGASTASLSGKLYTIYVKLLVHLIEKERNEPSPYSVLAIEKIGAPLNNLFGAIDTSKLIEETGCGQVEYDRARVVAVKTLLIDIIEFRGELALVTCLNGAGLSQDDMVQRFIAGLVAQHCILPEGHDLEIIDIVKQFSSALASGESGDLEANRFRKFMASHPDKNICDWLDKKHVYKPLASDLARRSQTWEYARDDMEQQPILESPLKAIHRIKIRLTKSAQGRCFFCPSRIRPEGS